MSKITLSGLVSLTNEPTAISLININSGIIQSAFDNTLSRDGTSPNQMLSVLDMNSNPIINLPNPTSPNSPLRLRDLASFIGIGTINTIPAGGTTGQYLSKTSNTDYAVTWTTPISVATPVTDEAVSRYNGTTGSLQNSLVKIDDIGTLRVPDDTTVNTGRIIVGTGGLLNSQNAGVLVQRAWTVTSTSLHSIADNTTVNAAGGLGFASFDSRVNFIGTQNYDHFNSFQSNVSYASSGTLNSFIGHTCTLTLAAGAGTITNCYGALMSTPTVNAGTITNCYGLFVDNIVAGSTFNRAIYTAGSAISEFGGQIIATTGVVSPGQIAINGFGGTLGFTAGSGATATQTTSKAQGVALNRPTGQITMNAAALAANTSVVFQLTNNTIAATDVVIVNVSGGIATAGTYMAAGEKAGAGTVLIHLRNVSAGSLSEAVVLQFVVIKGAIT